MHGGRRSSHRNQYNVCVFFCVCVPEAFPPLPQNADAWRISDEEALFRACRLGRADNVRAVSTQTHTHTHTHTYMQVISVVYY